MAGGSVVCARHRADSGLIRAFVGPAFTIQEQGLHDFPAIGIEEFLCATNNWQLFGNQESVFDHSKAGAQQHKV